MGILWTHPKLSDVAFEINDIQDIGDDKVSFIATWWNVGKCHSPYCMWLNQEVIVDDSWMAQLSEYRWDPSLPEAKRSV